MRGWLIPLTAFTLTVLLEWPVFALLSRLGFKKTGLFMLLMNMISWPIAIILYNYAELNIWLVELLVVAMETVIIFIHWRWSWPKALLFAFLINAASYFIGTPLAKLIMP